MTITNSGATHCPKGNACKGCTCFPTVVKIMRVRCVTTSRSAVPEQILRDAGVGTAPEFNAVKVGTTYTVYAILQYSNESWYFLSTMAWAVPSRLFEIIDPSVSRYWQAGEFDADAIGQRIYLLGYPGLQSRTHFERLIEGDPEERAIFERWADLLDYEFPDPSVKSIARHLKDEWVQCDSCADAWLVSRDVGLVRCPACGTVQNNPLWNSPHEVLGTDS